MFLQITLLAVLVFDDSTSFKVKKLISKLLHIHKF